MECLERTFKKLRSQLRYHPSTYSGIEPWHEGHADSWDRLVDLRRAIQPEIWDVWAE